MFTQKTTPAYSLSTFTLQNVTKQFPLTLQLSSFGFYIHLRSVFLTVTCEHVANKQRLAHLLGITWENIILTTHSLLPHFRAVYIQRFIFSLIPVITTITFYNKQWYVSLGRTLIFLTLIKYAFVLFEPVRFLCLKQKVSQDERSEVQG